MSAAPHALRLGWLVMLGVLGAAASNGQPTPQPSVDSWNREPVTIELHSGQRINGALVEWTPDVGVASAAGEQTIPWDQVARLTLNQAVVRDAASGAFIVKFVDDTRLRGDIVDRDTDGLTVETMVGSFTLDVTELHGLTRAALQDLAQERLADFDADTAAEDALLVARGADALLLRGRLLRMDGQGALLEWNNRETRVPWDRVAAVARANAASRVADCRCTLTTGQVIAGSVSSVDQQRINIQSPTLGEVVIPRDRLREVRCRGANVTLLTELEPTSFEYDPLLGRAWSYGVDETLFGSPVTWRDEPVASAIVMHSRSRLRYRLAGAYSRFMGRVGVLPTPVGGAAVVRVWTDQRLAFEAEVAPHADAQPIDLDLTDVGELTLEVDYGAELDIGDHVVWMRPRLTRPDATP